MKNAWIAGLITVCLAGPAMAANKYESRPAPARSYTPPPRPSSNTRQQEYKRQDRQNDNRRQDIYRAQQNRVVTDELKKKKH